MFFKKPPMVIHWHKPEKCEEMALDACKNVRLSKRATKLFLYYASCKSGFRPVSAVITEATGICKKHIGDCRNDLIVHGLVGYGEQFDNSVVVDWNRIRAFAMLEEPLQYIKSKASDYFKPIQSLKQKKSDTYRRKKTIGELGQKYTIKQPRAFSAEEVKLFEFLDSLTEKQYSELVHAFDPSVVFGGKMISEREHERYLQWQTNYSYDDSWMHTPEYEEKMRQDIVFLKNMPQDLPF